MFRESHVEVIRACLGSALVFALLLHGSHTFGQRFTDAALSLGVVHSMSSSDGFGAGASFFDFDNDGWDDITLINENDSLYFFHNVGGNFERMYLLGIINGKVRQALWVDYDNDGDNDLFVTTRDNGVILFRNDGNLALVDVTLSAGLAGLFTDNYGVSFADFDRDGDLDFYLARYLQYGDPNNAMEVNALFQNNGDGTFTNVTFEAGVSNDSQLSFMGGWMDYNKDGWPDLMVINDKLVYNNHLYHNNGDGTFTDVTEATGAEMPLTDAMSATFADFDNDLDLDFYSTSTYHATTPPKLLVNQNGEYFTEEAEARGLVFNEWSWGAAFFDADNDTNLDFYIASGFTTGHWQPEVASGYFENDGDHTYTNLMASEFAQSSAAASYGLAIGDANNDGYAEILSLNAENYNSFLWLNEGGENSYIKISLTGTVSNSMAIGSWINVFAGGSQYVHYTRCGEGYCSQHSQHHIFGLADATTVDSLQVVYLSGHTDTYFNLAVNEHHQLTEGETYTASLSPTGSVILCEGESITLSAGQHENYLWNTGDTSASIAVSEPGYYHVQTWNAYGLSAMSDSILVEMAPETEVVMLSTDVSCTGSGDGAIVLEVNSGELTNLVWNTGDTTNTIGGLQPGVYSFTAQNESGCAVSGEASITQPVPLFGQAQTTDVSCYGESTGVASLDILGGTPPYYLGWDELNPDSLPAGQYTVSVSDANNCAIDVAFNITQPDSLFIELAVQDATNGEENGSAGVAVFGGTPPYSVSWSTGATDTAWVAGLAPGDYSISVVDDNGCDHSVSFSVGTNTTVGNLESAGLQIFPNPVVNRVNIVRTGGPIGEIELYSATGERVLNGKYSTDNISIDVSNLPNGVYYMRFPSLTYSPHAKIVVQ